MSNGRFGYPPHYEGDYGNLTRDSYRTGTLRRRNDDRSDATITREMRRRLAGIDKYIEDMKPYMDPPTRVDPNAAFHQKPDQRPKLGGSRKNTSKKSRKTKKSKKSKKSKKPKKTKKRKNFKKTRN